MKGLSLNIIILGIVSLFTDISSEMVFPLLPLFLVIVLGAGPFIVGIVEGFAESTASILKVFSGYWSDKVRKRKSFIFSGYTLSTLSKIGFAFSQVWQHLFVLRVVERVGKGLRSAPRDALIAESCREDAKGKAFGLHRAMDTTGAIIGPLMAFALLPLLGFRKLFLASAIPAGIAVLLILFVSESRREIAERDETKIEFRALPRSLRLFIAIATIFALGNFSYAFILLAALRAGISQEHIILLYLLFNIVYASFAYPLGVISDRIGRRPVIGIGYLSFAFVCLGFAFLSSPAFVAILFAFYGVFHALVEGSQRAFVSDLALPQLKGTALGAFHTAVGLATLPASLIAGALWSLSYQYTFLFGFGLSMTALISLVCIKLQVD